MSSAEIADNKWEVQASKPQVKDPASIAQIALMGGFAAFFVYILIFSVVGMFSSSEEGSLESKFSQMNEAGAGEAKKEAPAE